MKPVLEIYFENGVCGCRNHLDYTHPVVLTEYEAEALKIINNIITKGEPICVQRRTSAYLSLIVGKYGDFCRLKITERAKWMSLDLWCCSEPLRNDPRLDNVTNKNQRHWKIRLVSIDEIQNYSEFINAAYIHNKNIEENLT